MYRHLDPGHWTATQDTFTRLAKHLRAARHLKLFFGIYIRRARTSNSDQPVGFSRQGRSRFPLLPTSGAIRQKAAQKLSLDSCDRSPNCETSDAHGRADALRTLRLRSRTTDRLAAQRSSSCERALAQDFSPRCLGVPEGRSGSSFSPCLLPTSRGSRQEDDHCSRGARTKIDGRLKPITVISTNTMRQA